MLISYPHNGLKSLEIYIAESFIQYHAEKHGSVHKSI